MLIEEFEISSTTESVISIIKEFRFRMYQIPPGRKFDDRPGGDVGSKFMYEITENALSTGQVIFSLSGTEAGVRVRVETKDVLLPGTGRIEVAPAQFAREVIDELKSKAKIIAVSQIEMGLNRRDVDRLEAVRGWPIAEQAGTRQEAYAFGLGISTRELRRSEKKFREKGIDTGWKKSDKNRTK